MASPLQQFEIKPLVALEVQGLDLSITNSALWMGITVVVVSLGMLLATRKLQVIPQKPQLIAEMLYDTVMTMVVENCGAAGKKYFTFFLTLFLFLLGGNLLGLLPGSFTFTSHIAVTFFLAAVIFVAVTIIGLLRHGLKFFSLFFPEGAPLWTAVILVPIEIISYFSRQIMR